VSSSGITDVATVTAGLANRPSRGLANMGLLAISIAVTVGVLELAARLVFPAPLAWHYPQTQYVADPKLIFALRPNQRSFSADKSVAINERGFRGPVVPYERTPGKHRVVFLGDSITFGYGVRDDEVVTERVRTLLAKDGVDVEVVNAAVPSYNTEQEVASYELHGRRYRPDWIVVGVCWNDLNDKSNVRVNAAGELVDADAAPANTADQLSSSPRGYALRNALKRSRLLYGSLERWRAYSASRTPGDHMTFRMDVLNGRDTPRVATGWSRVEAALRRLQALASEDGARILLVTFPIPMTLESDMSASSYPRHIAEFAARERVPFLDLTDVYRKEFRGHESLFIAYDGDHPNAAGHELAGVEIARALLPELR
jgi:lysophospholipase L1-like esterase